MGLTLYLHGSLCLSHLCVLVLFPSLAQLPGKIKEQRPVKKMIVSLKINDPLVTEAGNVHLSSYSESVVEQTASQI